MKPTQQEYHSYMLRIWRVREDGDNWRASLEEVQTGELHGFSKLEDLLNYLEGLTIGSQSEPIILAHSEKPDQ